MTLSAFPLHFTHLQNLPTVVHPLCLCFCRTLSHLQTKLGKFHEIIKCNSSNANPHACLRIIAYTHLIRSINRCLCGSSANSAFMLAAQHLSSAAFMYMRGWPGREGQVTEWGWEISERDEHNRGGRGKRNTRLRLTFTPNVLRFCTTPGHCFHFSISKQLQYAPWWSATQSLPHSWIPSYCSFITSPVYTAHLVYCLAVK